MTGDDTISNLMDAQHQTKFLSSVFLDDPDGLGKKSLALGPFLEMWIASDVPMEDLFALTLRLLTLFATYVWRLLALLELLAVLGCLRACYFWELLNLFGG